MTRNLFSKLIALIAGIILLVVAYNHNQKSLYEISGSAYGTRWSISSTEYISDLHKNNIISIIIFNYYFNMLPTYGIRAK